MAATDLRMVKARFVPGWMLPPGFVESTIPVPNAAGNRAERRAAKKKLGIKPLSASASEPDAAGT